jgi:hypothetical protein
MGSYWRSLRRAERIALISLLVTVVLGFAAVIPAYLAFLDDDDKAGGSGAAVSGAREPDSGPATDAPADDQRSAVAGNGRFAPGLGASAPADVGDTPGTHMGKWKGFGTQDQDTFPIYVNVWGGVAGAKIGEMFFPINECKFDLVLINVQGPVLTLQADLVNSAACGGARVTLTAESDGSLKYVVPKPDNPGVSVVVAPLERYTGAIPGA